MVETQGDIEHEYECEKQRRRLAEAHVELLEAQVAYYKAELRHRDEEVRYALGDAGRSDDLSQTVDYREVREVIRSVMEGPPRKLVEALAVAVAAEILRAFPLVQAVGVEVVKPRPPVDFASSGLVVRIRRARGGAA